MCDPPQEVRKTLALKLQLEGTPTERLHLDTERARLAAEADARVEATKDADLKRHERRLQLEQQYAAPPAVTPPPPLATAAPRAPTARARRSAIANTSLCPRSFPRRCRSPLLMCRRTRASRKCKWSSAPSRSAVRRAGMSIPESKALTS